MLERGECGSALHAQLWGNGGLQANGISHARWPAMWFGSRVMGAGMYARVDVGRGAMPGLRGATCARPGRRDGGQRLSQTSTPRRTCLAV